MGKIFSKLFRYKKTSIILNHLGIDFVKTFGLTSKKSGGKDKNTKKLNVSKRALI
jgi:hypothetical protein